MARSAKSIIAEAAVGVEDIMAVVYSGVATKGVLQQQRDAQDPSLAQDCTGRGVSRACLSLGVRASGRVRPRCQSSSSRYVGES